MSRRPRLSVCEGASPTKRRIPSTSRDLAHSASRCWRGGKYDCMLGSCRKKDLEVPERWYPSRRVAGYGKTTQGSAGPENSSSSIIIISDEDTQTDALGSDGACSINLLEDDRCTDNTLWVLGKDGFPQGAHKESVECLSSDQEMEAEFGRTGGSLDDSSDSCWSTASGPSLAVERSPVGLCKNCVKLITKMKKVKNWKNSTDFDPASLSCEMWVLKKRWHPRRFLNVKGMLWAHLSRIRKGNFSCGDPERAKKPPAHCSRPHVFLQRNLERCKTALVQSRRQARETKRRRGQKRSTGKPCQSKGSTSLTAPLPSGTDVSVRVADHGIGQETDKARRVLDFDETELLELSGKSLGWNATQLGTRSPSPCKRSPNDFSWVGKGGFRSMLSELKRCRSTVIEELHSSTS